MFRPDANTLSALGRQPQAVPVHVLQQASLLFLADSHEAPAIVEDDSAASSTQSAISYWTTNRAHASGRPGPVRTTEHRPCYPRQRYARRPARREGAAAQWLRRPTRRDIGATVCTCTRATCNRAAVACAVSLSSIDRHAAVQHERPLPRCAWALSTDDRTGCSRQLGARRRQRRVPRPTRRWSDLSRTSTDPGRDAQAGTARAPDRSTATCCTRARWRSTTPPSTAPNKVVVFYGGNDGLLRAINGNQTRTWQRQPGLRRRRGVVGVRRRPSTTRKLQSPARQRSADHVPEPVDGLRRDGARLLLRRSDRPLPEPDAATRSILFAAMRRGGRWRLRLRRQRCRTPEVPVAHLGGDDGANTTRRLGQTWSTAEADLVYDWSVTRA